MDPWWPHLLYSSCQISLKKLFFLKLECEQWFHPQEPVMQLPVPGELVCQVCLLNLNNLRACSELPYQDVPCPTWWDIFSSESAFPISRTDIKYLMRVVFFGRPSTLVKQNPNYMCCPHPPGTVTFHPHLFIMSAHKNTLLIMVSPFASRPQRLDNSSQKDQMWFFSWPAVCQ